MDRKTRPTSILVVDDSIAEANLVREAFEQNTPPGRVEIEIVHDAKAAIDRVRREPRPDLVIADFNLGGGSDDGTELTRQIKSDPALQAAIVLVMTGNESPDVIARLYAVHANAVLPKPTSFDELLFLAGTIYAMWCQSALVVPRSAPPLGEQPHYLSR